MGGVMSIFLTPGYALIYNLYGQRKAERSQVPYINHIDEGIKILEAIGADLLTQEAFAVHPVFQMDEDLTANWSKAEKLNPTVVLLAMEYRHVANDFLSGKIHRRTKMGWGDPDPDWEYYPVHKPQLSVLPQVNQMLIADKVQNRKDFEIHHKGTHPRSEFLDFYFKLWLEVLGISEEKYQELVESIR